MRDRLQQVLNEWRPGGATREQLVADVKSVVRPLLRYRPKIERAKYGTTPILGSQAGNDVLAGMVGKRAAVGRFGASELGALVHYLGHRDSRGYCQHWGRHRTMLYRNAGVYPPDPAIFSRFAQDFLDALGQLDALCVWFRPGENAVRKQFARQAKLMELTALEPYYHERPWTQQLAGKRVLVISPFAQTIEAQYRHRQEVWRGKPELLPEFHLRTIRVPLSAGITTPKYPDWFTGLDDMRSQMEEQPFDVALVGAGAWSLLLAVHAKKLGAMGVHTGGPTQIIFGVKGRRWESNDRITPYFNDAWVRPSTEETPNTVRQIENGCYW